MSSWKDSTAGSAGVLRGKLKLGHERRDRVVPLNGIRDLTTAP